MQVKPYAISVKKEVLTEEDIIAAKELSGSNAGICYLADETQIYFDSAKAQGEAALKRFANCVESGHHSVADHVWLELRLSGISKALAIWLNSLGFYNTSEKSGRYTKMQALDSVTSDLYNKWYAKVKQLCEDEGIAEKKAEGIAKENARMFLNLFAPITTMGYSTSIRNWNYIIDWCDTFDTWASIGDAELPSFYKKLSGELKRFSVRLKSLGIQIAGLQDKRIPYPNIIPQPSSFISDGNIFNTLGAFRFMPDEDKFGNESEVISATLLEGGAVMVTARMTFSCLAQLIRHRTLDVKCLPSVEGIEYKGNKYLAPIPLISEHADLMNEWQEDMRKSERCGAYPIGSTVWVKVIAPLENVIAFLGERCCGAAQYEIRKFAIQVRDKLATECKNAADLDWDIQPLLTAFTNGYTRCCTRKCNNPCTCVKEIREGTVGRY